jgi:hypothetical protein
MSIPFYPTRGIAMTWAIAADIILALAAAITFWQIATKYGLLGR